MAETAEELYNKLTPEQRETIAHQYLQQFQETGNPATQQKFASIEPKKASAKDLAAMHKHAETTHPGLLQTVRSHPLVIAAFSAVAAYEVDRHFTKPHS